MKRAKVIELIKQCEMTDYLQKLADAKMEKLVLFTAFPLTYAPNISDPRYFVLIKDLSRLTETNKFGLN